MGKEDNSMAEVNQEIPKEVDGKGKFIRQGNRFSTPFGDGEGELPVEAGRYRLIWSEICPWAHRTVIVRRVLGLEDVISLGTVAPLRPKIERVDWEFALDEGNKDPILGIQYLSEIYLNTEPDYEGRPTVPVVVDLKEQKVVNNDYFRLTNYFETAWKPFHKEGAPNLYPEHLREEIDELSEVIFHEVNNGVYKCGFARSQEAYEESYDILFARLDQLEERLSTNRFLFGDYITDADVRLYTTLARFDVAYYNAFKCNRNMIVDFPNLWGYLRDLYQTPGFGDTTNFEAIKIHYHLSNHIASNDQKGETILPKGPNNIDYNAPHNRETISGKKEKFLV